MISSGRPCLAICSSTGSRSFIELSFFSWIRIERVFEHDLHALRIGHEVGREVAAVELQPFDHLEGRLHALRFLDGDDAVLADLLHGFGDDPADGLVVVRRDGADLRDHVAGHRLRLRLQRRDDGLDGLLDAALDAARAGAGGDVLDAFAKDRLREHVAVVVPSPATSEVLLATSFTICAPRFSSGSCSSISCATVTPSLVMVGEPNDLAEDDVAALRARASP